VIYIPRKGKRLLNKEWENSLIIILFILSIDNREEIHHHMLYFHMLNLAKKTKKWVVTIVE